MPYIVDQLITKSLIICMAKYENQGCNFAHLTFLYQRTTLHALLNNTCIQWPLVPCRRGHCHPGRDDDQDRNVSSQESCSHYKEHEFHVYHYFLLWKLKIKVTFSSDCCFTSFDIIPLLTFNVRAGHLCLFNELHQFLSSILYINLTDLNLDSLASIRALVSLSCESDS